jgi:23S rRNA pseudouridine1911/1915/1917 synthase
VPKSCEIVSDKVERADRVVQALTGLPRRQICGLFDQGCVSVNGQPCAQTFQRVQVGDVVSVRYDPHQRYHEAKKAWKDAAFTIEFEDESILVVNKAAGFLTVPTPKAESGTLIDRVSAYLSSRRRGDKAYIVHRLDRGVSGLLVFGKSQAIATKLRDQFEQRKPQREYLAIVAGKLTTKQGTFRSHLATAGNLDRYSTPHAAQGQLAITHYRVDRVLPGATIVRVRLETGRRNQIRVHFAEAGHPVLGELRYHPEAAGHPAWNERRLALHAASLGFDHPVTGKPVTFESQVPAPMSRFIAAVAPPPRRRDAPRRARSKP